MRLRLAKVDEEQFLISLKKGVWGSKTTRFDDWNVGDLLVYIVDRGLAGIAEVNGEPFLSNRQVWNSGLFPFRIPVKFVHASFPSKRTPITLKIREILTSTWGPKYHQGIIKQLLLEGNIAETIVAAVMSAQNDLEEIKSNIRSLLDLAKLQRGKKKTLYRIIERKKGSAIGEDVFCDTSGTEKELTTHIKAQAFLIQLGNKIGCSVWISKRYRSTLYKGKPLDEDCLKTLPNLFMSDDIENVIASLDIVWFKHNLPICAFEVETTDMMCGGLIRFSDLFTIMPVLNTKSYIVTPFEKEDYLINMVSHPIFEKAGLAEYCKYLPIERLGELLSKMNGLEGYVQENVLETIAIDLQGEFAGNLDI